MNTNDQDENMARAMAVCYRLAQLLNIPIEDAVTVYIKGVKALAAAMEKKPN